jgi:hypothetical protein
MKMIPSMPSDKRRTIGSLLDPAKPQQCERSHPGRPEHHRIKRAELRCDLGCVDRAPGSPVWHCTKCQRVVNERIIGTQANGLIELGNGAVVRVRKP